MENITEFVVNYNWSQKLQKQRKDDWNLWLNFL